MKTLECVLLMLSNTISAFMTNMKMNTNSIVAFLSICDLCTVFLYSALIFYGKAYNDKCTVCTRFLTACTSTCTSPISLHTPLGYL